MRVSGEEDGDEIFLFHIQIHHPHSAPALSPVLGRIGSLHITTGRHHQHILLFRHQVFRLNLFHSGGNDFGPAFVAILLLQFNKLVLDNFEDSLRVGQNRFQFFNQRLLLFQLIFHLLPLKTGQLGEAHLEDGRGLNLGKAKLLN